MRAAGLTLLAAVMLGASCGGSDADPPAPRPTAATEAAPTTTDPAGGDGSLADAIRPLPPAPSGRSLPRQEPALPVPATLDVTALDVAGARIVPVGVEPDGQMEIPGPTEVGWYRYSPRPGDDGSAVLAAHIAYDGADGVFRHLRDLRPGDDAVVMYSDGSARRFIVEDVARYRKSELPDDIFARRGDPGLVLITCGGEFDSSTGRYADNVVARGRPA